MTDPKISSRTSAALASSQHDQSGVVDRFHEVNFQHPETTRSLFLKVVNTFFQVHFLWRLVYGPATIESVMKMRRPTIIRRLFHRLFWFWPNFSGLETWINGDTGQIQYPERFRTMDGKATLLVNTVIGCSKNRDDVILDLGCNCGRHLDYLYRRGFHNLHGIDVMNSALRKSAEWFPDTVATCDLKHDTFQHFLLIQSNRSFDIVYSHGATIELVHPSFDIVRHICRISRNYVVLLISEHSMGYPRFWQYLFRRNGFYLVRAIRPAAQMLGPVKDDREVGSLLVFKRLSD